jgi:16S rRNA (guanine1207-N2)-methyltransferase
MKTKPQKTPTPARPTQKNPASKKAAADPAMLAVLHPFMRGDLAVDDGAPVLLVNAVAVEALSVLSGAVLSAWQDWRGAADDLVTAGVTLAGREEGSEQDAVLVRLPRQREEARFMMAAAWDRLRVGGFFVVAAANDSGGGRLYDDLAPHLSGSQELVKHKCRIVWVEKTSGMTLPAAWREGGTIQRQKETGYWTQPGLFSWDRVDNATVLLLPYLPQNLNGVVADLGCGTGVIADYMLAKNPDLRRVMCFDADARAVEIARMNLAERHGGRDVECIWADLSKPHAVKPVDMVVMNPPFHVEKMQAVALGQAFIANAAQMLKQNGTLFMVANAHLPYEQDLTRHFRNVQKLHEGYGFKIITAQK